MKTYNVKEVAKMLNISEETVRRWIRSGKLKANMDSRKGGSVITENMLREFVKRTPKYAGVLATSLGGIAAASTLLLGSIIANNVDKNKKIKEALIEDADIIRILENDLINARNNVKNKRNAINQLEKEIQDEKLKIKRIEYLIKDIEDKSV